MKSILAISSIARVAALASAFGILAVAARANDNATSDRSAQVLRDYGSLPVKDVSSDIRVGSHLGYVRYRLGKPAVVAADGTWFYRNYQVTDSAANGTLVIRFDHGSVSQLTLVTPAVALAMQKSPAPSNAVAVLAKQ